MRWLFRVAVRIHTAIYRLSGGRVGASIGGMRMLILTTRGRRSGKARSVPLGYILDRDNYVVIGSYGGSARHPSWYLNLLSEPRGFVHKGRRIAVTAQVADPTAREHLRDRLVEKAPLYQKYQDRTKRQIPMVLLTPVIQ